MAKDPAVLLYTSDFLSGTYTMSDEQVGKYIRLLCYQHQKGKLTDKDMQSICRGYDEDVYSKFDFIDGYYVNKRMYEEAEKRSKFTESRRKNASAKHMPNHMDKHMENEIENENINENKNVLEYPSEEFKILWEEWIDYKSTEHKDKYKSKKTEQKAINHLIQLSGGSLPNAKQIVNYSIANKYKGLFELKIKPKQNTSNDKLTQYQQWYADLINSHENTTSQELPEIKKLGF
jgi:uncharacterized protein YdaU (DUF1376 family)